MTPEEKAKELVENYNNNFNYNTLSIIRHLEYAKGGALICVDEMFKLLNKPMFQYKESMLWKAENDYWTKVKQEIEKL